MIKSRADLMDYLSKDKYALKVNRNKPRLFGDEIWKFQIALRKHEYYKNASSNKLALYWYQYKHHKLGIKLGYSIPCNVFGPGLRINHYGYLVVNPKAKIGSFCDIHQGVNIGIGIDGGVPVIGDHVWIGPGAKLFGDITVANNVMVGANAVVTKSFIEDNSVLAGVPAKVINNKGNVYKIG